MLTDVLSQEVVLDTLRTEEIFSHPSMRNILRRCMKSSSMMSRKGRKMMRFVMRCALRVSAISEKDLWKWRNCFSQGRNVWKKGRKKKNGSIRRNRINRRRRWDR